MRISDWSSDVCSSDLAHGHVAIVGEEGGVDQRRSAWIGRSERHLPRALGAQHADVAAKPMRLDRDAAVRSEERRVGKECVSTCRSRWSTDHSKKNKNKRAVQ